MDIGGHIVAFATENLLINNILQMLRRGNFVNTLCYNQPKLMLFIPVLNLGKILRCFIRNFNSFMKKLLRNKNHHSF